MLNYQDKFLIAGIDEVGRGCLAGPVVAAAVIINSEKLTFLINDSKKISQKSRIDFAKEIKNHALCYALGEASVDEIDEINILQASILAMHRALDKMEIMPKNLLVDGNYFHPYQGIPHKTIIRGDEKIACIAAASIIAKTYRDAMMKDLHLLNPEYSWDKNKGYGTRKHLEAIQKFGFTEHHRKSFNIKKWPAEDI